MARIRLTMLSLLLVAPLAGAADKRSALEIAWLPIAVHAYPATSEPEVRDLGAIDPDAFMNGEGANLVLLGKTREQGNVREWQLRKHGARVGATLVVYWVDENEGIGKFVDPNNPYPESALRANATSRNPGSWKLDPRAMKVTVRTAHALYLRDCSKAPCAQSEARPVTTSLRDCVMPRCGLPPALRERGFRVLDRTRYAPTTDAVLERIDGAQINELVGTTYRADAVLGKSVVDWTGEDPAALLEQARRVGATRVLWWVEREREEHAVYLRDCSIATCGSP